MHTSHGEPPSRHLLVMHGILVRVTTGDQLHPLTFFENPAFSCADAFWEALARSAPRPGFTPGTPHQFGHEHLKKRFQGDAVSPLIPPSWTLMNFWHLAELLKPAYTRALHEQEDHLLPFGNRIICPTDAGLVQMSHVETWRMDMVAEGKLDFPAHTHLVGLINKDIH